MKESILQLIQEKGLVGMKSIIDEVDLQAQVKQFGGTADFSVVLSEMMNSFLYQMESSESLRDIISLEKGVDLEDKAEMIRVTKEILKKGTIYLFPSNYKDIIEGANLPFSPQDLVRDFDQNWLFGFISHTELPDWYFVGHVHRNDANDTYHTAYKKRKMKPMKTIDFSDLSSGDIYKLMVSTIGPRPIAFASTISADGIPNIAPYSYFNAYSSNPPMLVFSSNLSADGKKDTLKNVEETGEVVINMVNYAIVRQMAVTNVDFPSEVSEFEKSGLTPIPSDVVKPFRVKESPVQMECKVQQIIPLGTGSGAGNLILCEILKVHIDENILDEKGRVNPHKLDLMGRLGRTYYVRASGEAIHSIYQARRPLCIGFEQLPESVRNSKILTGNDLGQLAGMLETPTKQGVKEIRSDMEVEELLATPNPLEALHKKAQKLLASELVEKAAKLVWLGEEIA
ncbi:MAG: flavin reductase family protein [Bacteroidota bacterium]